MDAKLIKKAAYEIENEIIENRRYIHQYPEIGLELLHTAAFVKEKLLEMGYEIEEICKCGILARIGKPGKTLLIRADMDALPMEEINDLEFKSKNKCMAHTCGHDTHVAMLLGTAKLLKKFENELEGTVLLLFQPGEETLEGAKAVVEGGLFKKYKIDAAIATHIEVVDVKTGDLIYKRGELYASSDNFNIEIVGKGCHGAYPNEGIDPINVLVHIYLALQSIISREVSALEPFVLSIGNFHAGTVRNVIPDTARMEGTFRTYSNDLREFVKFRLKGDLRKSFFNDIRKEFIRHYYDYDNINRNFYPGDIDKYAKRIFGEERYYSPELKREAYLYLTFDEKYYQDMKAVIDDVYNTWLKELDSYIN